MHHVLRTGDTRLKLVCVAVCPTDAINFGERADMLALAKKRLDLSKKEFPKAMLADPDDVNVIYCQHGSSGHDGSGERLQPRHLDAVEQIQG